jgi:protocatechuate 3,4-dioxygenase beta subunit
MRQKPPPEGLTHKVKEGEWIGSIAILYGFADWEKDVWHHAKNTKLRETRKNPRTLAAGDELFIPPWQEKEESGATGQRHKFKLKTPNEYFRLRILDEEGEPVADAKYTLEIDCDPGGGTYKQQGTQTDPDGVLEEVIPSTAISGRLIVSEAGIDMRLDFGHLYPLDTTDENVAIRGAQQRLSSLGYYEGDINGIMSPELREAIAGFQRFCKENLDSGDSRISDPGEIDGKLSEKTVKALLKFYGC